ncbi:hypothetical protein NLG97_g2685 [Lecanicillium saksenae]|uniref:Uncharacterized protein n=1 Tax=Lecanicillium saksenae TaxID=468837 RepID=A0ACC1R0E3_9HYPO|nr:hypothetical protein NLG97_g2685 [Lecanicillium saksenae]
MMQTTLPSHTIKLNPDDYSVAWIAPLEIEAQAALQLLDHRHLGRFPVSRGNDYVYHAGSMGGHNIVIVTLPAGQEYGTGSAAALASQVKMFFPNLWFGLLVGVAAGLPTFACSPERDIRLGDVLVGLPDGESAGIVAYELGKETEEGFQLLRDGRTQAMTEPIVRSAISSVKLRNDMETFLLYYNRIRHNQHAAGTFCDPGQGNDNLSLTDDDGLERIADRPPRPDGERTRVWYGVIGSGDKLIKNAQKRNELRDKYGIIGLEMEASGTMNRIPVGVIRGVCDYGDRHKNKLWQPYAAAMAASYARALLDEIPPRDVHKTTYHLQFPKNIRFTGRMDMLRTLEEKFYGHSNCQRLALFGLGGVGKTQIAVEFMHQVKETQPDCSIFLVSLLNTDSAEQAFYKIAQKLGLQTDEGKDIKGAIHAYLNTRQAGKWLLVLDNVDDRTVISGSAARPGLGELFFSNTFSLNTHGRILITTRFGHIASEFAGSDVIEVGQMNLIEATELFENYMVRKQQPRDGPLVVELLQWLEFLPLAITQAASYLNQSKAPIQKYLNLLNETKDTLPSVLGRHFKDMNRQRGAQNAIGTTWIVSFRQLEKLDPVAASLLSFLAYIEPRAIPQGMLPGAESESEKMEWALGMLCSYSFLTRRGETDVFDMHNLVQLATRGWIEAQGRRDRVIADSVHHIHSVLSSIGTPSNRELCKLYLPHALRLLDHHADNATMDKFNLNTIIAHCLVVDRQFHAGIIHHESACRWARSNLATTDPSRLRAEQGLAVTYLALAESSQAIKIFEDILEAMQTATSPLGDEWQYEIKTSLGCAYLVSHRYDDAISIFKCLVTIRQTLNEQHPSRLRAESALAAAYYDARRTDEAIPLLESIVATRRTCFRREDPVRLSTELQLAKAYSRREDRVKDAIVLFEVVADNARRALPPTDIFLITTQNCLARAYIQNYQPSKAIGIIQQVIATSTDILTEYDPIRQRAEMLLGKAYIGVSKYPDPINVLERLVLKHRKTLIQDHQTRVESEAELAKVYIRAGQIKDGCDILERLLPILKLHWPESHPVRVDIEYELGRAYCWNGRLKDGISLLERPVALLKKRAWPTSWLRRHASYTLALAYFWDNRVDEAYEAMKEVILAERDLLPEDHPRRRKMETDYDMICRKIYERD